MPADARDPQADDEQVGRHGEDAARLADPRRLPYAISQMNTSDSATRTGTSSGHDRADRLHPGGRRHAHGQDVVEQERDPGELRGQQPEVVLRHDVGAAGGRVGLDRLAVGEDQDRLDQRRSRARSARRARTRRRPTRGPARGGSPRWRRRPTTCCRRRRRRARSACPRRSCSRRAVASGRPEQQSLDAVAEAEVGLFGHGTYTCA